MDEIQKFLFDHLDNNGEIHLNYDKSAILLTMINEMKCFPIEVTQESNPQAMVDAVIAKAKGE